MPLSRAARSSSSSSNGHSRNSISNETAPTSRLSLNTDSQSIDPRIAKRFEEQELQVCRLLLHKFTPRLTTC
jgi:hypothetical protein